MKNKVIFSSKKIILILFLLGATSSLGFPPLSFFFLTIISYSYTISLIPNTNTKKTAFFMGFWFGLGHHLCSLYWIAISFELGDAGGYFVGFIAVTALASFLSIFTAISFYCIRSLDQKLNLLQYMVSIVLILTLTDWIKGNMLWSFPWLPISAIWSFSELTLYPFSLIGKWGYSLVTYSIIIGFLVLKIKIKNSLILFCPLALVIIPYFFEKAPAEDNKRELHVRIVQPNISQKEKWLPEKKQENFYKLIELSQKKTVDKIDLIIWPETSLNFDLNNEDKKEEIFRDFIKENQNIIVGLIRKDYSNKNIKIYNSLFLFNSENEDIQIHDKVKLVPFGEFIPLRKILKLEKLTAGIVDFSEGNALKSLELKNGLRILPLICYEVIFPNIVDKNQKYNLLVNITNDGWYGKSFGPYQHLGLSKIRAVEEGKTLLRVANTGISAVINYNGKIMSSLALGKTGVIDRNIKFLEKKTLYKKYGDNLFYVLIGVLCLYLLILKRVLR